MPETKVIIELDQQGNALRVLVAKKDPGQPLNEREGIDLNQQEIAAFRVVDQLAEPTGKPRRGKMAFFEGNCVWINGKKYCT